MARQNKGGSTPTRFSPEEEAFIEQVRVKMKLSRSEVVRRAVAFAVPKFLSGEVNILTGVPEEARS